MLEIDELCELMSSIHEKIDNEIMLANRSGEDELKKVLEKYGFSQLREEHYSYIDLNSSKVLLVGHMRVKQKDIIGICKSLNIDYKRLDYVTYDEATNYNWKTLRYSNKYSDVIFGSVPHSGKGMGDNASMILALEKDPEEYPKIIRATDSNELKFTKTSLKEALKKTRIFLEQE